MAQIALNKLRDPSNPWLSTISMKCPTCKKETESAGNPYRPFCSERCKLIDLGKWAGGEYRIPTKERPTEEVHRSNGNREDEE
jgi:uncharacterized protein